MTNYTRNFAKLVDGVPSWGPIPLAVVTHHHDEGVDEETQEPWTRDWDTTETVLFPTAADYARAGYKPVVDELPPDFETPDGKHYEAAGWGEFEGAIHRVYELRDNPPPAPRKWSRLSLKTAFARAHILPQLETYLSGVEVEPDYNGWQALTDCDYIEEGYGGAEKWAAMLDGAATALGKTRAEIDAFLDAIPREA